MHFAESCEEKLETFGFYSGGKTKFLTSIDGDLGGSGISSHFLGEPDVIYVGPVEMLTETDGADAGEQHSAGTFDTKEDFAAEHHESEADEKDRADEEWKAEERHEEVELAFSDLGAVDAAEGTAGPDAGKWDEEESNGMAGGGAEFKAVSMSGEPSAFRRAGEVDGGR